MQTVNNTGRGIETEATTLAAQTALQHVFEECQQV